MKNTKFLVLLFIFIFTLSGCGAKSTTPNSNTGATAKYKDGTYDVKHKSIKPGYEEAVVTIKDSKIQNIELKRLDDNQKEINYNDWDGTKKGFPNLKQARIDLSTSMVSKQSPDVDTISGATQSSEGWKVAVTDALAQAH